MIPLANRLFRIASILRLAVELDYERAGKILDHIESMLKDDKNFDPSKENVLGLSTHGIEQLKKLRSNWPEIDREIGTLEKPFLNYFVSQYFANFVAAYQLKHKWTGDPKKTLKFNAVSFYNSVEKSHNLEQARPIMGAAIKTIRGDFKLLEEMAEKKVPEKILE